MENYPTFIHFMKRYFPTFIATIFVAKISCLLALFALLDSFLCALRCRAKRKFPLYALLFVRWFWSIATLWSRAAERVGSGCLPGSLWPVCCVSCRLLVIARIDSFMRRVCFFHCSGCYCSTANVTAKCAANW